ncbi:UNVERIFIED_CONTAM: Transaldolase [Sesamum radiatum]|uniref:Transaldolase n=1 Tax=Sesamum radiatum TaxID=300843 RepID=A0AAW2S0X8_SESRA
MTVAVLVAPAADVHSVLCCVDLSKRPAASRNLLSSSKLSLRSNLPVRVSLVVRCSKVDGNGSSVKRTTLHDLYEMEGQSPWYDNLCRPVTDLIPLIESGVRGVTSNPAIFQKAISTSSAYNDQFRELVQSGKDIESAYWELVVKDIQDACKLFEPIYDQTDGADGYVSVEVSPKLADDTENTIEAAKWLHQWVDRPNVYIKIPATAPCIPSIKEVIARGISVNVTLIFSLARYEALMLTWMVLRHLGSVISREYLGLHRLWGVLMYQVASTGAYILSHARILQLIFSLARYEAVIDAYLDGLEASGLSDLSRVTSVASFFVSRVDTLVDKLLEKIGTPEALDLRGKAANAQAALAYQLYQKKFSGPRWEALVKKGAKKQRLLWASTSVKNPAYPDTLYVAPLIGPDTVSTMPDQALQAFVDHGKVARTIDSNVSEAEGIYSALEKLGIDWSYVGSQLELEGVDSFKKSFDSLLDSLQEKANSLKLVSM